jgi:hypothetical protein
MILKPQHLAYCLAVLLLPLFGNFANAKDFPFVIGAGGNSCGTWTTEKKSPRRLEHEAWLVGYLSAANRFAPGAGGNLTNGVEGRGLIAWMDNYCSGHPLDMIETGAVVLIEELLRRHESR